MEIYRELEQIQKPFPRACVTIGNFDGVHIGHQLLFADVVQKAYKCDGTSVAITFDPHPLQVLRPDGIKLISTCEQKTELIGYAGIDVLVIVPFNMRFATTTADHFVDEVLLRRIGVKELVVGYDYAFGKGRVGNIDFLKKQGAEKGFGVTVIDAHYEDGMLASSTKIRELVCQGRMADAKNLLGRYYQIRGVVALGKQRGGREIGFPTANLYVDEEDLVPKIGVYVAQVICNGKCYGGVLNVGYNPTFDDQRLVAEVHIFDFNQDIYGKPIKVNLLRYLRGEQKFAGISELSAQIARDVLLAREILTQQQQEIMLSCEEKFNS
ncbi:MAG: bifunctional riboflavin kinase/FAD synthetase [Desulfobulbaceae bacterium]|uniref:Riboflavin biosynthesis protein n=1 Tax=Candidatus Desulfatifera sulfidica TaxID=2841691 RepID=A0A8J6TCC9_9BACT|nr:bifunctional riboflavin kinase/FAD synthetase [Candidatus Desulfatifera sulfidica]